MTEVILEFVKDYVKFPYRFTVHADAADWKLVEKPKDVIVRPEQYEEALRILQSTLEEVDPCKTSCKVSS